MLQFEFRGAAVAVALGLASQCALATNGDQMTALSAPTAAMGGATIVAPRDALTVLYNPAGVAELVGSSETGGLNEVRMDFGFGLLSPPRKVNGNESDSNLYMMPSGAVVFHVNPRLFVGMGMGGVSGMGVNVPDVSPMPGNQPISTTKQVFRLSPAVALRVNDKLTVGGSLNIGYQSIALSTPAFALPQNQQFGFGASVGAIYKFSDALQTGFTYISKLDIKDMTFNTPSGKVSFDMDMPAMYGIGVAFKPREDLLFEFDIKRIQFSDVMDSIEVSSPGAPYPPALKFGWDDQTVYALGVRKIMNPKTTLLAGFNYGKSPIESADVPNNLGSTAVVEKHLSIGLTRKWSKHVRSNFAYTHAFNNKVTSTDGKQSIEMYQHQLNVNVTYTF